MYDVVKNDPGYARNYYKGNATAIRNLMNENAQNGEFRNYNEEEGESSADDEWIIDKPNDQIT